MKVTTLLLSFATFAILLSAAAASAKNIMCYFSSWAVYRPGNGKFDIEDIDTSLCTHIYYAFLGLTPEGNIRIVDNWESSDEGLGGFTRFTDLSRSNPDLKLLVSMGGWNEGSRNFSIVAADPAKRQGLAVEVVKFLKEHKLHGFDIDWDYPEIGDGSQKQQDAANFVKLIKDLKAALTPGGYLLSAAVSGGMDYTDVAYVIPDVSETLDIINVMTYDYHGNFDQYVGHPAPLTASSKDDAENATLNVKSGIEHWIKKGANPAKMHLGVITYGRSFTLADPKNAELFAPVRGAGTAGPYTRQAGVLAYNEICELYQDWTYIWDDEQQVPHRVSGNQWVGYDDQKSLTLKVKYAKHKGLGGIMVWSVDTDDFNNVCGKGRYPLINAIKKTLNS